MHCTGQGGGGGLRAVVARSCCAWLAAAKWLAATKSNMHERWSRMSFDGRRLSGHQRRPQQNILIISHAYGISDPATAWAEGTGVDWTSTVVELPAVAELTGPEQLPEGGLDIVHSVHECGGVTYLCARRVRARRSPAAWSSPA